MRDIANQRWNKKFYIRKYFLLEFVGNSYQNSWAILIRIRGQIVLKLV